MNFWKQSKPMNSKTLFYYPEYLSSTSGTQSLLPVMMSEYAFYSPADVDDYLLLLQDFRTALTIYLITNRKSRCRPLYV